MIYVNFTNIHNISYIHNIDNISVKLAKNFIIIIAPVLSSIINNSFQSDVFPNLLKISRVTPIFKSEDPNNLSNYRPISLLLALSKIFEKIVYKRLFSYGTKHKIIYNRQILLEKLNYYGVRGICNKFFESYLMNRYQYTSLNNVTFNHSSISQGVPQGSILGPLLFILYINDQPNAHVFQNAHAVLYADDSSIFVSHKDRFILQNLINDALVSLGKWLFNNKLHLDVAKCHYIIFKTLKSKSLTNFNLIFGNESLNRVNSTKFLGFYIDSELLWTVHLNMLLTKLARTNGMPITLRYYTNIDILMSVYYSLVYSYLQYGIILWGIAANVYLNPIKILQKKALRFIIFQSNMYPSILLARGLHVLLLDELYLYLCLLFMFSVCHNLFPCTITSLFQHTNDIHCYNTRLSSTGLNLVHARLEIRKNFISFSGVKSWNSLDENFRNIKTISLFRRQIFDHLFHNYLVI